MLNVLMTVYNETDFVEYAIESCLPYVDSLTIVEGAYQETIKLGASPRSDDGTIEKIQNLIKLHEKDAVSKITYLEANEQTDKDQRNVGLEKIKCKDPNGWLLIIDGDEVYDRTVLNIIKMAIYNMEKQKKVAAYFKSLTFVDDFEHFTEQEFPRLFQITPQCKFSNDNYMEWPEKKISWFSPGVMKFPYIKYHHYAFCKGSERFLLKKAWWETRFGRKFDYGWHVNKEGKITDPNHKIYEYTGNHPEIMKKHPMYRGKP